MEVIRMLDGRMVVIARRYTEGFYYCSRDRLYIHHLSVDIINGKLRCPLCHNLLRLKPKHKNNGSSTKA